MSIKIITDSSCDLGINFIATCYDSYGTTTFFKGRHIKAKRGNYKILRKKHK